MSDSKKYYWLKLKENFFEETYVKALRRLPDGDKLAIVYLKLQLKNLKNEGILKYKHIMPNHISEISLDLDEDENIVKLAITALINMKIIDVWDDETLYLSALQPLIGTESESAERVRRHREKKALQCNVDVTEVKQLETKCNTEIEIEKEKREKKKDSKKKQSTPKNLYEDAVLLTDDEYSKLVAKFGEQGCKKRILNLSLYIQSKGDKYQSHYATILHWESKNIDKESATAKPRYQNVKL
jgi:predicted phage replisome organizer